MDYGPPCICDELPSCVTITLSGITGPDADLLNASHDVVIDENNPSNCAGGLQLTNGQSYCLGRVETDCDELLVKISTNLSANPDVFVAGDICRFTLADYLDAPQFGLSTTRTLFQNTDAYGNNWSSVACTVTYPCPSTYAGDVYYLDPVSGSNSNTGRLPDDAWRTAKYAVDNVPNNAQLLIRNGTTIDATIFDDVMIFINRDNLIIDGYGDGDAWVIDGNNIQPEFPYDAPAITLSFGLLELVNCRNCVVRGGRFINSRNCGITIRNDGNPAQSVSSNNIIEYNETRACRSSGIQIIGRTEHVGFPLPEYVDGTIVRYNIVDDVCTAITETTGALVTAGEALTGSYITNTQFYGNEVKNYHKEGIVMNNAIGGVIHNNWIHDSNDIRYGDFRGPCIYIDASTNGIYDIDVYSNYLEDDAYGVAIASETGGPVDDIRVFNNIIVNTYTNPIVLSGDAGHGPSGIQSNIVIAHNLIHNRREGHVTFQIAETDAGKLQNVSFVGNVVYRTIASSTVMFSNSTGDNSVIEMSNNVWYNAGSTVNGYTGTNAVLTNPVVGTVASTGQWPHAMNVGPKGVSKSVSANEWTPTAPSLKNAIVPQGGVTTDIAGESRGFLTDYGPYGQNVDVSDPEVVSTKPLVFVNIDSHADSVALATSIHTSMRHVGIAVSGGGYTTSLSSYIRGRYASNPREGVYLIFRQDLAFSGSSSFTSTGTQMLTEAAKSVNWPSILGIAYQATTIPSSTSTSIWQVSYDQYQYLVSQLPVELRSLVYFDRTQRRPSPNSSAPDFDRWALPTFDDSFAGPVASNPIVTQTAISAPWSRFMSSMRKLAQFKQVNESVKKTVVRLAGCLYKPFTFGTSFNTATDTDHYIHNPMLYSAMQWAEDIGVSHIVIDQASIASDVYGDGTNPTTWIHPTNAQGYAWVVDAVDGFLKNTPPTRAADQYGIEVRE